MSFNYLTDLEGTVSQYITYRWRYSFIIFFLNGPTTAISMTHLKFAIILVQTLIIPKNYHLNPGLKDFLLSVWQIQNLTTF